MANRFTKHGFRKMSFATPIKAIYKAMALPPFEREVLIYGLCAHYFGDELGYEFARWVATDLLCPGVPFEVTGKGDAGRAMMQNLGHGGREKFGKDIWLKAANKQVGTGQDMLVIDDVRYPNELEWAKERGFITVRLEIPQDVQRKRISRLYGDVSEERINHVTETLLDSADFDIVHHWRGETPQEVYKKVVASIERLCIEEGSK